MAALAHRELIPDTTHSTEQNENNRAEQSHEATRVRERSYGGQTTFKDSDVFNVLIVPIGAVAHCGRVDSSPASPRTKATP